MKPAVFLDRDGTLIEEKNYLHRPEEVVLYPDTAPALQRLLNQGFDLFIVTNQSGVGRGYFSLEDVHRVHARLFDLLKPHGVRFRHVYIAPEAPDQQSSGRKPSPHFLFGARDEYQIDLGQSYMIGDKRVDLQCGTNAGVRQSILVRTGYGKKVEKGEMVEENTNLEMQKVKVVDNLSQAADWILGKQKGPAWI